MYRFKNSLLKEDFPFLIREAERLHPNDPNSSAFIRIAKDLLFLDKQDTLEFIQKIQEDNETLMFYAISASCWVRFPHKSFMETLKKEIDRFKNARNYKILLGCYQEGVKFMADTEAEKQQHRMVK